MKKSIEELTARSESIHRLLRSVTWTLIRVHRCWLWGWWWWWWLLA